MTAVLLIICCIDQVCMLIMGILLWREYQRRSLYDNYGNDDDNSEPDPYRLTDWKGREVDHLITFRDFCDEWLSASAYIGRCHDFTTTGFQYDEGGSMGLTDTLVGFKTQDDARGYSMWFASVRRTIVCGGKFPFRKCIVDSATRMTY